MSPSPRKTVKRVVPPPVPTGVTGEWFPASVRLPGSNAVLHKQRVFATPEGAYVYSAVPAETSQSTSATPNWFSPIKYELTQMPPPAHSQASKVGFVIMTDAGPLTVQMGGGCACGARALQSWRPVWATSRLEWRIAT